MENGGCEHILMISTRSQSSKRSAEGLKMDLEKVKAILEWHTLRSVTKVRSFHGLATFYRKFIRIFSSICDPLTETMRGDRKEFKWTLGADKSFNLLKQKVAKCLF